MAQWLNRILAAIAPDPVNEALVLLSKVKERNCFELTWVLRRFRAGERPRQNPQAAGQGCEIFRFDAFWSRCHLFVDMPKIAALSEGGGIGR